MGVNRDATAVRDATVGYDLQTAQPAVPVGCKQTEVGVIPEDWCVAPLHQEIARLEAGVSVNSVNEDLRSYPHEQSILKTSAVSGGRFYSQECKKIAPRDLPRVQLSAEADSILISRMNTPDLVGECGYVEMDYPNLFLPDRLWITRKRDGSNLCARWLSYLLSSKPQKARIKGLATGTSGSMKNITKDSLLDLQMPFPPPEEQRAIATTLSDVDALLEGLDRLIAKKRDLKQAAMQQLLTGETRLPGFEGEWVVKQLDDLAQIVMGQSPNSSNYNSRGDGLPLIQGNADISGRKTIKRVFTTQITKHGRAGDILMSVRAPVGEISRATFDVCLGRGVCALRAANEFLYHYLIYLEPSWAKHSKGSTFDSVNSADIKTVEVRLPSDPNEQSAIAAALSDMDVELETQEQRRAKTSALKQAMMQELLTGRTRLVTSEAVA